MQDYRKLNVWQKSHQLTLAVYKATLTFPKEELYGLTSQVRRACVSIPANIVEGCGRKGKTKFSQFLHIALGSAGELEYYLLLASELGYLKEKDSEILCQQVSEIKQMLTALITKVKY